MKMGKKGILKALSLFLALSGCTPISINKLDLQMPKIKYEIREVKDLLRKKALKFEKNTLEWHITPEGLFAYNIDISKSFPGNPYIRRYGDVAIFTGIYLASQAFRYGVTNDEEALNNIRRSVKALHNLQEITGVEGLIARYYGKEENTHIESRRDLRELHKGSGKFEGYVFVGNPSVDQLAGVFFGYAIAYDVVKDEGIRKAIREDVSKIMDHIVENGMLVRDVDGERANFTNMGPTTYSNSNKLMGLSFLKTAYHITGNKKYQEKYKKLIKNFGYAKKTLNVKWGVKGKLLDMEATFNDNVAFLGFYNLIKYENDEKLVEIYKEGIKNYWEEWVKGEGNSFLNFIFLASFPEYKGKSLAINEAIRSLYLLPEDKRGRRVENSKRNICKRKVLTKHFKFEEKACYPLPINERPIEDFYWQRDPYKLDGISGKNVEYGGLDYLIAYWFGVYHGFIK